MTIESIVRFAADHPAMPGHFPGNPIVPGALLLDRAAALAKQKGGWLVTGVRKARFKKPLPPETDCRLHLSPRPDGALDLTCSIGDSAIMIAILDCSDSAPPP